MLTRLYLTAFATRLAERSSGAGSGSLEQALVATGITLAAGRKSRKAGLALIVAGAAIGWQRRHRAHTPRG